MFELTFVVDEHDTRWAARALYNADLPHHYSRSTTFTVLAHHPDEAWADLSAELPESARRVEDVPKNAEDHGVE